MPAIIGQNLQDYCTGEIKKRRFQESDIEFPSLPLQGSAESV